MVLGINNAKLKLQSKASSQELQTDTGQPADPQLVVSDSPTETHQVEACGVGEPKTNLFKNKFSYTVKKHSLSRPKTSENKFKAIKIAYIIIGGIMAVLALALIVISVCSALVLRQHSLHQSVRLCGLIIIIIVGFLSIALYLICAGKIYFAAKSSLKCAAVSKLLLALVVIIVLCACIRYEQRDEDELTTALLKISIQRDYTHAKIWPQIQHELKCCGVYGPNDYGYIQGGPSPEIPIACCPEFEPSYIGNQEHQRQMCRANKSFYQDGCYRRLTEKVSMDSFIVQVIGGVIIALLIVLSILLFVYAKMKKKIAETERGDKDSSSDKPASRESPTPA